jgi:uncharacterized protein DUF3592
MLDSLLRRLIGLAVRPVFRSLTGFFHDLQDRWRALGKRDWLLVNGTIEITKIDARRDDWVVMFDYSYPAAGEFWSGRTYRVFFKEGDADDYARQHPSGSVVVIRHHPVQPSKSVVLKEDQLSASAAGTI